MTDIVELILADHREMCGLLSELVKARSPGCAVSPSAELCQLWAAAAELLEVHADAEEEICFLALFGPGQRADRAAASAAHDDIREAVTEARLKPPGSPTWWLAVQAAHAAAASHARSLEAGALGRFRREAPAAARAALGRQWLAFRFARKGCTGRLFSI